MEFQPDLAYLITFAQFENLDRLAVLILLKYPIFFFFVFLGPHFWHMDVPRLGVKSELELPVYTIATATPDPCHICDLTLQFMARGVE